MPDFFCNSFETTRFFSKILGLGGLRQLPNSPKGRPGPASSNTKLPFVLFIDNFYSFNFFFFFWGKIWSVVD